MKSPRRNMPMRTVIVAAIVVERFAPIERIASPTKSLALTMIRPVVLAGTRWTWPGRSLIGAAALVADDGAVVEGDDALAHLVHHLAVVGRHHDGRPRAVDPVEELHDPDRGVGVEVPGWLVADEERRVVDERARDRDALLLAARELLRTRVHLVREPDEVQNLGHLPADLRARLALDAERVADVLRGGAIREELEVLED